MPHIHNTASVAVHIDVVEEPIKTSGAENIAVGQLEQQANLAISCVSPVDYTLYRGTCIDERRRIGLRSGENHVEPRPSVPGGPNIYGLAVAELTGYFKDDDSSGEDRLTRITGRLNDGGIRNGGHEKCAANAGLGKWMRTIAEQPDFVKGYARLRFGDAFDGNIMDEVVAYARAVVASDRYTDWDESVLPKVLGDEEAGQAIEKLDAVDHEALTIIRNWADNTTVDQTELYNQNEVGLGLGKGSFVNDEGYADKIEHIIASGPDSDHKKLVAEYAREAILAAVAAAVPNKELYQINLYALAA